MLHQACVTVNINNADFLDLFLGSLTIFQTSNFAGRGKTGKKNLSN